MAIKDVHGIRKGALSMWMYEAIGVPMFQNGCGMLSGKSGNKRGDAGEAGGAIMVTLRLDPSLVDHPPVLRPRRDTDR